MPQTLLKVKFFEHPLFYTKCQGAMGIIHCIDDGGPIRVIPSRIGLRLAGSNPPPSLQSIFPGFSFFALLVKIIDKKGWLWFYKSSFLKGSINKGFVL